MVALTIFMLLLPPQNIKILIFPILLELGSYHYHKVGTTIWDIYHHNEYCQSYQWHWQELLPLTFLVLHLYLTANFTANSH